MASTTTTISRRTMAKGAAWAVPAITFAAAAPAMAASVTSSDYTYGFDTSIYATFHEYDGACTSQSLTFTNSANASGKGIYGFIAGATSADAATDATGNQAVLESLVYYAIVPKGLVSTWTLDNSHWSVSKMASASSLALSDGTAVSTVNGTSLSSFDVFKFVFDNSVTTNDIYDVSNGGSASMTWPNSDFTATAVLAATSTDDSCVFSDGQTLAATSIGDVTYKVASTQITVTGTRVTDNTAILHATVD